MEFKEKFIGFVDILGFKQLVASAESGNGISLPEILELVEKLGRAGERQRFERHGARMCPAAPFVQRDLDFRATQVSDCVILSAELSPAGGINLIDQAWMAVTELLVRGILCRGYITRGKIYHTDTQFIGSGYQQAYDGEGKVVAFRRNAEERGTPFVEIDNSVRDYLQTCGDPCVKEMFSRLVKDDGTVTALFPFQQFCAKFMITPGFDPVKQKASNQNLRVWLRAMKEKVAKHVDQSNPSAVMKLEHYLTAFDAQLAICDRTDEVIEALARP
jgi:hypothetical protein